MSIQVYMTDWWALHVCQEIQVKPSPLNSGFCILTLILFLEELGGMLQKGSCVFSLFGSRSVCCHCLLHQPLGWVSDVVYLRTAGKEKEVGERLKSTAYRWMRYRHSYILIFFFTVARERKDETMLEVTVVSCIWCFSHSHQLYVAVGIRNCHLLCDHLHFLELYHSSALLTSEWSHFISIATIHPAVLLRLTRYSSNILDPVILKT